MREIISNDKDSVKDFWNRNVCQTDYIKNQERGTKIFFEESEQLRYHYHYHLLPLFDNLATEYKGGKLLEIGCSMGTDLLQMARRGFSVTGVDLTEAGIDLARQRFALYELSADLEVGDAENLRFEDKSFDVVYSFGVIHHTPDTEKAVQEIHRVLKIGGLAVIMLYYRPSLNYIAHKLLGIPADGSRSDPVPVAKTYTKKSAMNMFQSYSEINLDVDYLFGTGWGKVNRFMPKSLHRALGKKFGWHLMIRARK